MSACIAKGTLPKVVLSSMHSQYLVCGLNYLFKETKVNIKSRMEIYKHLLIFYQRIKNIAQIEKRMENCVNQHVNQTKKPIISDWLLTLINN